MIRNRFVKWLIGWCPRAPLPKEKQVSFVSRHTFLLSLLVTGLAIGVATEVAFLSRFWPIPTIPPYQPVPNPIVVTRWEIIWTTICASVSNYRIIYLVEANPHSLSLLTITDYIGLEPDLYSFDWSVVPASENVQVGYDFLSGKITIEIQNTGGRHYRVSISFLIPSTDKFVQNEKPRTSCSPTNLSSGQDIDFEIRVSPFKIQDMTDLRNVEISAWVWGDVENRTYLGSTPEALCSPQYYQAEWLYGSPPAIFEQHAVRYHVRVRADPNSHVVFLTSVNLSYDKPIYAKQTPTIGYCFDNEFYSYEMHNQLMTAGFEPFAINFVDKGSNYWYEYRHVLMGLES